MDQVFEMVTPLQDVLFLSAYMYIYLKVLVCLDYLPPDVKYIKKNNGQ